MKKGTDERPRAANIIWKDKLEDPVLDSVDLISEISVMMQVQCACALVVACLSLTNKNCLVWYVLWQLDHRNIVKIYDVFEDDTRVIIVEELVNGGELFNKIVDDVCDVRTTCRSPHGFITSRPRLLVWVCTRAHTVKQLHETTFATS